MAEVFRTPAPAGRSGPRTLVVHCSSAAYRPHFAEFLERGLGLRHYALLALPGGVQTLTLAHYLPKFSWAGWRLLTFLAEVDQPARVIFLGHQDCRWYGDLRFWDRSRSERGRMLADLRQAGAACAGRFPACRVELYFARPDGGQVVFESC